MAERVRRSRSRGTGAPRAAAPTAVPGAGRPTLFAGRPFRVGRTVAVSLPRAVVSRAGAPASGPVLLSLAPILPLGLLGGEGGLLMLLGLGAAGAAGLLVNAARQAAAARRAATEAADQVRAVARGAAEARAEGQVFKALACQDAPYAVIWLRPGTPPQVLGLPERGVPDLLGGEAAERLDAALLRWSPEASTFTFTCTAQDGRSFHAEGRRASEARLLLLRPQVEGATTPAGGAFAALLDVLPAAVWTRGADGGLGMANPAFLSAVGAADVADARSRGLELLDQKARDAAAGAEREGGTYRGRVRAVAHGQRRLLDVVEVATASGAAGIAIDATEEEAAKAETQRVVAAHRRTLDQLTTAVAIFGADERLVFHNAAYERLFGLSPGFLDQRPSDSEILETLRIRRKVPEQADFRAWRAQLRDAYRAIEPVNDWWHLPGGQMLRVVITPNAEGGVTYLFDDLSEHVALESRYNSLIRIQGETLDGLAEAVAVFASDGRLHLYNEAFLALWSLDAHLLGDKPHIDAVAAMCRPLHGETGVFSRIRNVVTALERREAAKLRLERADGRVLDGAAQPLPDGGTLVTFRDVTDSVQVQRALEERAEALEAADKLKNAFVGHVSYHLRTPLNTLMGYADMLREGLAGPLEERQRTYLDHMRQSSDVLRSLIDDILDLATVDAGAMELDLDRVEVRPLLDQVAEAVHDQLDEGGVVLAIAAPDEIGGFTADARRVRQILFNLLANAIAVSPRGAQVTLGAARRGADLVLTVRDQGPGVPDEVASTLFERFESRAASPRHRGAGLGLAIVRSFVELHGGTVSVAPARGGGTIATCIFPVDGPPHRETAGLAASGAASGGTRTADRTAAGKEAAA